MLVTDSYMCINLTQNFSTVSPCSYCLKMDKPQQILEPLHDFIPRPRL